MAAHTHTHTHVLLSLSMLQCVCVKVSTNASHCFPSNLSSKISKRESITQNVPSLRICLCHDILSSFTDFTGFCGILTVMNVKYFNVAAECFTLDAFLYSLPSLSMLHELKTKGRLIKQIARDGFKRGMVKNNPETFVLSVGSDSQKQAYPQFSYNATVRWLSLDLPCPRSHNFSLQTQVMSSDNIR